jgi:signal transduction histidine kinase
VTLAVAAAALLPPLDRRLRREEVASLQDTAVTARTAFRELPEAALVRGDKRLVALAARLQRRTGARVAIFDANEHKLVDTAPATPFGPVPQTGVDEDVPRSHLAVGSNAADVARVAVPTRAGGERIVVALRKPLDDVSAAAHDVRAAFTDAALAGLGIALLVGAGLAGTLLRRLRRLRAAALEVAEHGLGRELPEDRSRDEVGDLSRAFARMQERLRREEEVRRNFVATASHEMRTPLTSLQGMLELLEQDLGAAPPDLDDARNQARRAEEQTQRLTRLASDLLDLTRLDADVELRREPVEVREVCRAVIAEFEVRVGPERVELCGARDVRAAADPGSVARVVRILVDNAIRYSPTERPVTVTVGQTEAAASIAVRDAGHGVPAEERELIFERFRRGSAAGAERGFGLGLAIARELARRMGGDLVLTHDADPGACFELRLPPLPAVEPEGPNSVPRAMERVADRA